METQQQCRQSEAASDPLMVPDHTWNLLPGKDDLLQLLISCGEQSF